MARDELLDPAVTEEDLAAEQLAGEQPTVGQLAGASGAGAGGDDHGGASEQDGLTEPIASLRPRSLDEFVGQSELKRRLRVILEAARRRGQPPDHFLFAGPPGLGKTSLSVIVAAEMEVALHITSGPALERPGDLAAILTKLGEGDVLVHRRDPSPVEIRRRGALPGDGGLPARHRAGQGAGRPLDPTRPASLLPGRRDDPHRA